MRPIFYFTRLICLLGVLTGASRVSAQDNWDLKKDQDGIKVYSRKSARVKFNELKVETSAEAKLSDLVALILDIPDYPEWSYNTKTSYVLKQISNTELYFYTEIHSPWPASNRDLAIHLQVTQDPTSKILTIKEESVPTYIPSKDGIVRVPFSKETWTVTPAGANQIRIVYQVEIDPGANAPAWLVNLFADKAPYETFKNIRQRIGLTKYRGASIPFITN